MPNMSFTVAATCIYLLLTTHKGSDDYLVTEFTINTSQHHVISKNDKLHFFCFTDFTFTNILKKLLDY